MWSVANNIHLNRKTWVAIKLEDTKKGNQKPEIEDRQTTEYPIEKGQKELLKIAQYEPHNNRGKLWCLGRVSSSYGVNQCYTHGFAINIQLEVLV